MKIKKLLAVLAAAVGLSVGGYALAKKATAKAPKKVAAKSKQKAKRK